MFCPPPPAPPANPNPNPKPVPLQNKEERIAQLSQQLRPLRLPAAEAEEFGGRQPQTAVRGEPKWS